MTAPRVTHGGAIWQEDRASVRTYGGGVHVAAPGHAGDVTIAQSGAPVAELRRLADGDAYLVSTTDVVAHVPDPAHAGDAILGDPTATGARVWIADPSHPGDVILGTGTPAGTLTRIPAGTDTLYVGATAVRVPVLVLGADFVVT